MVWRAAANYAAPSMVGDWLKLSLWATFGPLAAGMRYLLPSNNGGPSPTRWSRTGGQRRSDEISMQTTLALRRNTGETDVWMDRHIEDI